MITRTERGWGGHFICAHDCLFRRNTLLVNGRRKIVVSTVGNMSRNRKLETIGYNRYYETMAFVAHKEGAYWEADVSKELSFESDWAICAESAEKLPEDVDNVADRMHERVVAEFIKRGLK